MSIEKTIRAIVPVLVCATVWLLPVPAGVTAQAWHLLAIFLATITALILQPLPLGATVLISVTATMVTDTSHFSPSSGSTVMYPSPLKKALELRTRGPTGKMFGGGLPGHTTLWAWSDARKKTQQVTRWKVFLTAFSYSPGVDGGLASAGLVGGDCCC